MIQIIGYMIAAYGMARLVQTSARLDKTGDLVVGMLGIGALILLAVMLTQQADSISSLAGGL